MKEIFCDKRDESTDGIKTNELTEVTAQNEEK